jgi:16S rRNA (cytidine1402-2'-O)-methyltransferase
MLYLVATPIGNLEDITLRALRVLREVRLIAAEDTRHTRQLLNHFEISTPCISYHEHNKLERIADIVAALAEGDVALVSDAGTPGISDPGYELVRAVIAAGFPVSPIPGPSAPIAALISSGLAPERFCFVGFLPRRAPERRALLSDLAELTLTLICFEAPHRITDALLDIQAVLGDRQIVLAREITKRYEEFQRGRASELLPQIIEQRPRGEYTIVIAGRDPSGDAKRDRSRIQAAPLANEPPSEAMIARRLRELRAQGQSSSTAARTAAREFGLQKSVVYQVWLSLGDTDDAAV